MNRQEKSPFTGQREQAVEKRGTSVLLNYNIRPVGCRFMTAREVAEACGVSISHAYALIRQMNKELKEMGKLTIAGKVPRKYFEFKVYGG